MPKYNLVPKLLDNFWDDIEGRVSVAAVAQLGERETEDLKVTGSIPVRGTLFVFYLS
jgi:hypothetical protein